MDNKRESLLLIAIAFVVGVLVGVIGAKVAQDTPSSQAPNSTAPPPAAAPQGDYQQQITQLRQIVAQDPENRNAWARLGHAYFDSNQPAKAIEAYDKALALNPNDANLLTDQGVMFRRMGWYDKAVENFKKANEIDPNHAVSLFNLGIVYRYDLENFDKAIEAWEKYLQANPSGQQAEQVRAELEFLKSQTAPPRNE